jgi:hypothetical protein
LLLLAGAPVAGTGPENGTTATIDLDATALRPGERALLSTRPVFRVLGVWGSRETSGAAATPNGLETLFEGPSEERFDLKLTRGDSAPSQSGAVVFPFNPIRVEEAPGLYLGFLRLVGRWEVAVPGAAAGDWDTVAGQDIDYEVPVFEEHLDHPTACVTIQREQDGYRALISDSCGPGADDGDTSK